MQDYHEIQDAFPGGATPAIVAIEGDAADPELQAAVAALKKRALASGKALEPIYVFGALGARISFGHHTDRATTMSVSPE